MNPTVAAGPCPSWCQDRSPDHFAYDATADAALIRVHSAEIGYASVVQDEHLVDGQVILMPVAVHSYVLESEDLTAAEAREAAADLLAAAERLEQITSEGADR